MRRFALSLGIVAAALALVALPAAAANPDVNHFEFSDTFTDTDFCGTGMTVNISVAGHGTMASVGRRGHRPDRQGECARARHKGADRAHRPVMDERIWTAKLTWSRRSRMRWECGPVVTQGEWDGVHDPDDTTRRAVGGKVPY